MKQVGRVINRLVACGVALFIASVLTTRAGEGTAKVQAISHGAAQYSTDGKEWQSLSIGTVLKAGSSVKTDAGAVVDLFLKDNGPVVRVTPATRLDLTTLTFDDGEGDSKTINTELGLQNGRVLGAVKKLAAASKYEVKTPKGTCGIRGTKFDISASGKIVVVEGAVLVRYTNTQGVESTQLITKGQTFDPAGNGGAGAVVPTAAADNRSAKSEVDASIRVTVSQEAVTEVVIVATPKETEKKDNPESGGREDTKGAKENQVEYETEVITKSTGQRVDGATAQDVVNAIKSLIGAGTGLDTAVNQQKDLVDLVKTINAATTNAAEAKSILSNLVAAASQKVSGSLAGGATNINVGSLISNLVQTTKEVIQEQGGKITNATGLETTVGNTTTVVKP